VKRAGIALLLLGAVIFVVALNTGSHGSPAPSPTPSIQVQVDTTSAETSQLTGQIEKLFKDKNLGQLTRIEITNYEGGGYGVYLEYQGLADVKLAKYQMATAYIGLHKTGANIQAMSLYDYAHVQDAGGNDGHKPYLKTLMQPEAIAKVNWSADEADLTQDILPSAWSVTQDYSSQVH
jgi:hypothetical protein